MTDFHGSNTRAMNWSLAVGVVMLVGKSAAYWLTGSAAILSDAVESVIHIAAVAFAAYSLRLSQVPASKSSPYGYGRMAFLSAGFEGGMISIAALWIIVLAAGKLISGGKLESIGLGTLLTLAASLINLVLGLYLVRTGRKSNSLILEANGKHVLTDSWTSFGVVAGLAMVWLTGWVPLDPLVAIGVALNILWSAWQLMRRSVRGLLDLTEPDKAATFEAEAMSVASELGIAQHRLRFRDMGNHLIADVHLVFPDTMPIAEAHALASRFESSLAKKLNRPVEIITHLEPWSDHEE